MKVVKQEVFKAKPRKNFLFFLCITGYDNKKKKEVRTMSLEKAKKYLEEKGYADHVIELEESGVNGPACSRST